jgi:hypothetical protein
MLLDGMTTQECFVSTHATESSAGAGYFSIQKQANTNRITMSYWHGSGQHTDTYTIGSGVVSASNWHHIAVVRSGTTHSLYIGDAGESTGTRVWTTSHTAYSIGASSNTWVLGRLRNGASSGYNLNGRMDEVSVIKSARYSGTSYDVPTEPYTSITGTTTHVYARNSAGEEVRIV